MTESLLAAVASHETKLVLALEQAKNDARRLEEEAHAEAAGILAEAHQRLDAEIAARRRDAAAARAAVEADIEADTRRRAAAIREAASGKMAEVKEAVLSLLLPTSK